MPIPLIPIALIGASAIGAGIGISQAIRARKLKKIYAEAWANGQRTHQRMKSTARDFEERAGAYGNTKAQASDTLKEAADFLEKARVKHRDFYVGTPQDFQMRLEQMQFQAEELQLAIPVALNVVLGGLPVGISASIWSIKKGNEMSAKVDSAIKEISTAETNMDGQVSIMGAVIRRMSEVEQSIISARDLLSEQLAKSAPDDLTHAHAVYKLADMLGKEMDAETITTSQAAELGMKINAPALGKRS